MIYDRIKLLMDKNGIKIEELSSKTGVPISTIKKWNHVDPSVSSLALIAKSLDTSVDYLSEITDDPQFHKTGAERAVETLKKVRANLDHEIEFLESLVVPNSEKTDCEK